MNSSIFYQYVKESSVYATKCYSKATFVSFLWMQPGHSMTKFVDATSEGFDLELRQPCWISGNKNTFYWLKVLLTYFNILKWFFLYRDILYQKLAKFVHNKMQSSSIYLWVFFLIFKGTFEEASTRIHTEFNFTSIYFLLRLWSWD